MPILIELGLTLVALGLAFILPGLWARQFGLAEQKFAALARRRRLAVLTVGLAVLALRAALLPVLPVPIPQVDDEFSYLLAADTFAHGRLTNPTPPMWQHFETLHILMQPSYQSKYPPAQGLVLAAGKVIAGQPFLGVWLSVGVMCAAICWMLQGWLPAEWALLGGLLAVLRYGVFSYWANSYWGGAVAATGGALLLGALPRILKSPRTRDALLMGIGLAALANSRPYEGLILSLPVAVVLLVWLWKKRKDGLRPALRRVVLPLFLVLAVAAASTGYYFWRVTGSAFQMPYQVYEKAYDPVPPFVWQSLKRMPSYRHTAMRELVTLYNIPVYERMHNLVGLVETYSNRLLNMWFFYLGPVLTLPLLMAPFLFPGGLRLAELRWETRFLLLTGAVSGVALAVEVYGEPHYAAPITCLILAFVLLGMRRLRTWSRHGKPSGLFLSRAIPVVVLLMFVLRAGASPLHIPLRKGWSWAWYGAEWSETSRSQVASELNRIPGRDLVLVHYHAHPHSIVPYQWPHSWVYNGADIAKQKIIWAWDMGPAANRKLIHYFRGRRVWLIDLGEQSPKLIPYPQVPVRDQRVRGVAASGRATGS